MAHNLIIKHSQVCFKKNHNDNISFKKLQISLVSSLLKYNIRHNCSERTFLLHINCMKQSLKKISIAANEIFSFLKFHTRPIGNLSFLLLATPTQRGQIAVKI